MRIILPKFGYEHELIAHGPLIFLAGPVLGGGDWQHDFCVELERQGLRKFVAAIPCRWNENHPLWQFHTGELDTETFDRQLTWERIWLEHAAVAGCIAFWLPAESKTNPRGDGLPYAMDTRGELGEWRGRMMVERQRGDREPRVVVGGELGFPGIDQIHRNFNLALKREFPTYLSLEETVAAVIRKVRGSE